MQPSYHLNFPWYAEKRKWSKIVEALKQKALTAADISSITNAVRPKRMHANVITTCINNYTFEYQGGYSLGVITGTIFPNIVKALLDGPKLFPKSAVKAYTLPQGSDMTISFTRRQARTIVACMWFGLLSKRLKLTDAEKKTFDEQKNIMSDMSFDEVFASPSKLSLHCILSYFYEEPSDVWANGEIIIARRGLGHGADDRILNDKIVAGTFDLVPGNANTSHHNMSMSDGTAVAHIESMCDVLGASFLNVYMTETTLLLSYCELWLVALVCPALIDGEVIVCSGAIKYNNINEITREYKERIDVGLAVLSPKLFILANVSGCGYKHTQYTSAFTHDLFKLRAAFGAVSGVECLTMSKWSNVESDNNPQLRFLQAVIAAAGLQKKLIYVVPISENYDAFTDFASTLIGMGIDEIYDLYAGAIRDTPDDQLESMTLFELIDAY